MIEFNFDLAANHASQIARLEDEVFGNNLQVIYGIDKLIKVIYVMNEQQLVAFLTFKRDLRNVEIYNFAVREEYRGSGIGSRILNTLTTFDCSLEVRESNVTAISFYKKNSFEESFIRKNYYGKEHAIVLERKRTMTENAYAKINLILNVVDKLDNGYHQIEFLMNSVDLHDVVTVTRSEKDEVIVTNDSSLNGLDNLAYKALSVLRDEFGFTTNYKIEIEKHIPVAAGMAGGSSDAAAVMRIINVLEDLQLDEAELAKLGARVGSDVSYCIYSRLAIARGTGEEIELVTADFKDKYVLVINPGVPLSTIDVYKNHVLNNVRGDIGSLLKADDHIKFENGLENSLAPTAKKLCPQIEQLEAKLKAVTDHRILVSGSGPTLLVFSESRTEIEDLYNKFKDEYQNIHIAEMK